jgi:hypothetical protein
MHVVLAHTQMPKMAHSSSSAQDPEKQSNAFFLTPRVLVYFLCFILKELPIFSFLNFFSFNTNSAMNNKTDEISANKEEAVTCTPPCTYSNTGKALKVHIAQHHSDVIIDISEGWRCVAYPIWSNSKPVLRCEHCNDIFNDRRAFTKNHVYSMSCPKCKLF